MEINKKLEDLFFSWIEKYKETSLAWKYANTLQEKSFLNAKIWTYYHCACEIATLLDMPKPQLPEDSYEEVWQ